MIRAVLADSGPLYAAIDEGDKHHGQALEDLQKLVDDRRDILVLYPILLEAHNLVLSRLGTKAALRWLTEMASVALMNPTPEDYNQAHAMLRGLPDQRISLFDATVAVIATRTRLDVWTYDHHFDVMRVPVWR
jgi:predicted nucleic acid-binding protein